MATLVLELRGAQAEAVARRLQLQLQKLGVTATTTEGGLRRSGAAANFMGGHMKALLVSVVGVTGALRLMRAGIDKLQQSVGVFIDFEASFTRINTLVGISRDQLQKWTPALRDIAAEAGRTGEEMSEALFTITSGGIRGAEALDILRQSSKAAAIGLGDTATIARTVTAAMQAFAAQGLEAGEAVDILVATIREGNLEAETLAPVLGRVTGVAASMGATFADVNAFIATFTRLGVGAEEAVTALRGTLNLILNPGKQVRVAMKGLGIDLDDVRRSISEDGLAQALIGLVEATKGNLDAIGELVPNVRALSGILGTAGVQAEQFVQIQQAIRDSLGLTNKGFKIWGETAEAAMDKMSAASNKLQEIIGEQLTPTIVELSEAVTTLAGSDQMERLVEQVGRLTSELLLVSTAAQTSEAGMTTTSGTVGVLGFAFEKAADKVEAFRERVQELVDTLTFKDLRVTVGVLVKVLKTLGLIEEELPKPAQVQLVERFAEALVSLGEVDDKAIRMAFEALGLFGDDIKDLEGDLKGVNQAIKAHQRRMKELREEYDKDIERIDAVAQEIKDLAQNFKDFERTVEELDITLPSLEIELMDLPIITRGTLTGGEARTEIQQFSDQVEQGLGTAISQALASGDISSAIEGFAQAMGAAISVAIAGAISGPGGIILGAVVGGLAADLIPQILGQGGEAGRRRQEQREQLERDLAAGGSELLGVFDQVNERLRQTADLGLDFSRALELMSMNLTDARNALLGIFPEDFGRRLQDAAFFNEERLRTEEVLRQEAERAVRERLGAEFEFTSEAEFRDEVAAEIEAALLQVPEAIDLTAFAEQLALEFAGVSFEFLSVQATAAGLKAEIEGLGLSAEETARLVGLVTEAEALRMSQLETDVLQRLVDVLSQVPALQEEAAALQAQINQARFQIELQIIELQLRAMGLMTEAFEEMLRLAGEFAQDPANFAAVNIQAPGGGGIGRGRGGRRGRRRERRERVEEFLARFELNSFELTLHRINQEFDRMQQEARGFPALQARLRRAQQQAIRDAMMDLMQPLVDLRDSLRDIGATPVETILGAQSEFFDLAQQFFAGDRSVVDQLAAAGADYRDIIRETFGGTVRGRALLEEMERTLDRILGGPSITGDRMLDVNLRQASLLEEIRDHFLGRRGDIAKAQRDTLIHAVRETSATTHRHLADLLDEQKRATDGRQALSFTDFARRPLPPFHEPRGGGLI